MKDNKKVISTLSNITFGLALAFTAYLLINFFIVRRGLPPGMCPIDQNRTLMYSTIGLAILSFILSIIESRLTKQ